MLAAVRAERAERVAQPRVGTRKLQTHLAQAGVAVGRDRLAAARLLPSMMDANHCYQNALAERLNGILKDELNLDCIFATVVDAHHAVAQAIHTYNHRRLHGSLQRQTPAQLFAQAA